MQVSYDGGEHDYNLKYKFWDFEIDDSDEEHPHMEFQVNDTNGGAVNRSWQWNHVAMVYNGKQSL